MPNYVFHNVFIYGSDEEIDKFRMAIGINENDEYAPSWGVDASTLSFHKIIPVPKKIIDLENLDETTAGNQDAIDSWRKKNWGTTSDAIHVSVEDYGYNADNDESGAIILKFDTAWTPAIPVILAMQEKFTNLRIEAEYLEPNEGFAGDLVCDYDIETNTYKYMELNACKRNDGYSYNVIYSSFFGSPEEVD